MAAKQSYILVDVRETEERDVCSYHAYAHAANSAGTLYRDASRSGRYDHTLRARRQKPAIRPGFAGTKVLGTRA